MDDPKGEKMSEEKRLQGAPCECTNDEGVPYKGFWSLKAKGNPDVDEDWDCIFVKWADNA